MYIYDSIKKKKLKFEPLSSEVRVYICGPTVYDDAHLGHAKSAISFDILARVLRVSNYKVKVVKNFTDVDDNIIKKAKEERKTLNELTRFYIDRYLKDMASLNVKNADIEPYATNSIDKMTDMIEALLNNGYAYKLQSGDVYFDITKDGKYLSLSSKTLDSNQHRIDIEQDKRNEGDYVLWKAKKESEDIYFKSSIGDGRPGWHIECSAMIEEHLAYKDKEYLIDIHCGGMDLLFPHHENEASQSRCYSNKELSKYWLHNGFVQIKNEKMSKSLGNSFFVRDILEKYHGEIVRFYLLSSHYRADFNFSQDDLAASKKRLDRLYRAKRASYGKKPSSINKEFKNSLLKALQDDLNTSKALAIIDEMTNSYNTNENSGEFLANIELIDEILGFGGLEAYEYFQFGIDKGFKKSIEELIKQRDGAKKDKNYTKADSIRDKLSSMGVSLMDGKNGTVWEVYN